MEITIREYEFLQFVQSGEDWNRHSFVEIVDKYWSGRKQGILTSPPDVREYKPTGNAVMDKVNLEFINQEYPDSYIWSGQVMNEDEYIVLQGKLQSLSLNEIGGLQYFINASLAESIYIVQG